MLSAAAYHRAELPDEAERSFLDARAYLWSTRDTELQAELEYYEGVFAWSARNLDAASRHARAALNETTLSVHARALELLGAIAASSGNYLGQADYLERALTHIESFSERDVWVEAHILYNLSILVRELHLDPIVDRLGRRMESLPWTDETAVPRFEALRHVAWCNALSGNHVKAFRLLRESAEIAPTIPWRIFAFLDRSMLAREIGEAVFAEDEMQGAEAIADGFDWNASSGDERLALLQLAELTAQRAPERAQHHVERYRAIKRKMSALHAFRADRRLRALECYAEAAVARAPSVSATAPSYCSERPLRSGVRSATRGAACSRRCSCMNSPGSRTTASMRRSTSSASRRRGSRAGSRWSSRRSSRGSYTGSWQAALDGNGGGLVPDFQYHHQPYNYFANYAPGTAARAEHLKDGGMNGMAFIQAIDSGTLPQVAFYKPQGNLNEHAGYTDVMLGDRHIADVVEHLEKSPQWGHMLVIVTYDENGGWWDHVAPPKGDRWGPKTWIPAFIISPYAKQGIVDHTRYRYRFDPALHHGTLRASGIGWPKLGGGALKANGAARLEFYRGTGPVAIERAALEPGVEARRLAPLAITSSVGGYSPDNGAPRSICALIQTSTSSCSTPWRAISSASRRGITATPLASATTMSSGSTITPPQPITCCMSAASNERGLGGGAAARHQTGSPFRRSR